SKPVTSVKRAPTLLTFEKPPAKAVFSFTGNEITRRKKGSQEDPCMSYLPLTIKQAIKFMNEHIPILLSKNKK
ncbi:hypothetical protein MMS47_27865, partial [Escherichia coli]|nr:hypothetical protein [Streptococcus infantis]MCM4841328.1 hypothetical protein [Escherichia coli]